MNKEKTNHSPLADEGKDVAKKLMANPRERPADTLRGCGRIWFDMSGVKQECHSTYLCPECQVKEKTGGK